MLGKKEKRSNQEKMIVATTDATSLFDVLPQTIATTSILPFIATDDWLQFRVASRNCYEIVHGTNHVAHAFCPICQAFTNDVPPKEDNSGSGNCVSASEEAENLWNLALVREYRFDVGGDNLKQSIHSPSSRRENEITGFLMTRDVFTAPSSFISWKHWRKIEARRGVREEVIDGTRITYPNARRCTNVCRQTVGPYYLRAASMWKLIEEWCEGNNNCQGNSENSIGLLKRDIKRSLAPGVDVTCPSGRFEFEDLDIITALSAVYSFYSGQFAPDPLVGLFGGYSAYGSMCMMEWFDWTHRGYSSKRNDGNFIIAHDATDDLQNSIILDVKSGAMMYVSRQTREAVRAITDQKDFEDSILRWFEEYARRISSEYYSIGQLDPRASSPSILHYPSVAVANGCSRAVTRGVEVVASSTYHPFSNLTGQGIHIYSLRLRLLTSDDGDYITPEERGFLTCQLHSRHWVITKSSGGRTITEDVKGKVTFDCSKYRCNTFECRT